MKMQYANNRRNVLDASKKIDSFGMEIIILFLKLFNAK